MRLECVHSACWVSWLLYLCVGCVQGSVWNAGVPADLALVEPGHEWLSISWAANSHQGTCTFASWSLEWRAHNTTGSWGSSPDCVLDDYSVTSCNLTGLQQNTPYDVRVTQICAVTTFNSDVAVPLMPFWTLPGEWEIYVGPRSNASIEVDVLHQWHACYVATDCCTDHFSFCDDGAADDTFLNVTRTDTQEGWERQVGWGQPLRLRCVALSMAAFTPAPSPQPADPPDSVQLFEPTASTMYAWFHYSAPVGDCNCAIPHLQLRAADSDDWFSINDTCADVSYRKCTVSGLAPDTIYEARIQVACADEDLNSNFTYSTQSVPTLPPCWWQGDSGQEDQFLCQDGTYCNMTGNGPDSTDETCCNSHGGRHRCPSSLPVMCASMTCAGSQDYCCATDCTLLGGTRPCTPPFAPAKAPAIELFESFEPAALTLRWTRGAYHSGRISPCVFSYWHVEMAQHHSWGRGSWTYVDDCASVSGNPRFSPFTCNFTTGLVSMTTYDLRIKEVCDDPIFTSTFSETTQAITTRPWMALASTNLACVNVTHESFALSWSSGDPRECTFEHWQVQQQLMPRSESTSSTGYTQPGEAGSGSWSEGCTSTSRGKQNCSIEGLLSDRAYAVQVRERCTDPHADSNYAQLEVYCHTVAIPSREPVNVTGTQAYVYAMDVSWDASDPRACLFVAWEVQAVPYGSDDWPNSTLLMDGDLFACLLYQRNQTSCTINVGLGSGIFYDVRVRERCTEPAYWSDWAHVPTPGISTLWPERASTVENLTVTVKWPELLSLEWDIGSPGLCDFTSWLVELSVEGLAEPVWIKNEECAEVGTFPRAARSCSILQGLPFDEGYLVRVREDCTDINARSLPAIFSIRSRQIFRPEAPEIMLFQLTPFTAHVMWEARFPYDCTYSHWNVQVQLLDDNGTAPQLWEEGLDACRWPGQRDGPQGWGDCLITGLTSKSPHELRIWEVCSESNLTSEYTIQLFNTPSAPATAPTKVELADPTENSMLVRFWGSTVGDCLDAFPEIQFIARGGSTFTTAELVNCTNDTVGPFGKHDILEGSCTALGMLPDTLYFIRVHLACPTTSLSGNFTDAYNPLPTLPGCKWSTSSGYPYQYECVDGSLCNDTASCCNDNGGRERCPDTMPVMCANDNACSDAQDYCCEEDCSLQGGPRPCGPESWPAKVPEIILNASIESASLTLVWTAPKYLSGLTSPCVFQRWSVQFALVHDWGQEAWQDAPNCQYTDRTITECFIGGLVFLAPYVLRLAEVCTDPLLTSFYNVTSPIITRGELAGTPSNISVDILDATSLTLFWDATTMGDCNFSHWEVNWQLDLVAEGNGPVGPWVEATGECASLTVRNMSFCTVTGLQQNRAYTLRVREACVDERTNSLWGVSSSFRWTESGDWEIYLGTSTDYRMEVNILSAAARCSVRDPCCGDQFSVCPTPTSTDQHRARIDRVDAPGGWGQAIWLACTRSSAAANLPAATHAEQPLSLVLFDSSRTHLLARYDTGAASGDCECATPSLQMQTGSSSWVEVGGDCNDPAFRECKVDGLEPDTLYYARLQMSCSDPALSSNFTEATAPLATLPGCWWWPHSGQETEYECVDSTFCSMENETCCSDHGGRLRCPSSRPLMCMGASSCAGGTDYCCEVDCTSHGGPRPCTDAEVPARQPVLGQVEALSATSIQVSWAAGEYLSTKVSLCRFDGWLVELAEAVGGNISGPWFSSAECGAKGRADGSCVVQGLLHYTPYFVRVAELCTVPELRSVHSMTELPVVTLPQLAGVPENLTVVTFGIGWLSVTWDAGNYSSDCVFEAWNVAWLLADDPTGEWMPVSECRGDSRSSTSCTIPALQTGEAYALRLSEGCADPSANSPATETVPFRWFGATAWQTRVTAATADTQVDVLMGPTSCSLNCSFGGNFSICYGSPHRQHLTITRTDSPSTWDEACWLSCTTLESASGSAMAPTPTLLEFYDASYGSVGVRYEAGFGLESSCNCAGLDLQLRPMTSDVWVPIDGLSWSSREGLASGLAADTQYEGRLRISCAAGELNSSFLFAQAPFITTGICKWMEDSGSETDLLCNDGSLCPLEDDSCCNERGGRLRCPSGSPVMCQNSNDCAGQRDHCCSVDCSAHGGPRQCNFFNVPAKPPEIVEFASYAAGSLTIAWAEGHYLAGDLSLCDWLRWSVEVALVTDGTLGPWTVQGICDVDHSVTSCMVSGLQTEADYHVRVAHVCTESQLNSLYNISTTPVRTLPKPAGPPAQLSCGATVRGENEVLQNLSWEPGLAEDCVFDAWEVRYAIASTQTPSDPTVWALACLLNESAALASSCLVEGLASNELYHFAVRSLCTDSNANSGYSSIAACTTDAIPADPVQNLTASGEKYVVHVGWDPGYNWSCVFSFWEVQLQPTAGNWSAVFHCEIADRMDTKCSISVGLGSGAAYDVRVREVCRSDVHSSSWMYLSGGVSTLFPDRAGNPGAFSATFNPPFGLDITWEAGVEGDCVFTGWLVEVVQSGQTGWREVTECAGLSRSSAGMSCKMLTDNLTSASYDLQVRETCTDLNAWSSGSVIVGALELLAPGNPPSDIQLLDASYEWLVLGWTSGSSESGCSPQWLVVWGIPPDGGGATVYDQSHICQAVPCNVTGLTRNTPHLIRIMEACSQPPSEGVWVTLSESLWTLPGEWEVFIGSAEQLSVHVDTLQPAHRCYVVKECCADEFTVCDNGAGSQMVTVTRADVPGGWGQHIRLHCLAPSQAPFAPALQLQATPAATFLMYDPTVSTVRVRLPERLGGNLSECYCARPRLEIQAAGSSAWQWPSSDCEDLAVRECTITGLNDGTEYTGRIQIVCDDPALSSGFSYAEFTVATISPIFSVQGTVSAEVASTRRLASVDQLATQTRLVVADIVGVPMLSVYVHVNESSTIPTVDFEVPAAIISGGLSEEDARARADEIVALLGAQAAGQQTLPELVERLQAALPWTSVQVLVQPHSALRTQAFPTCPTPEPVQGAADSWSPLDCRGRTWSSEACVVPCAEGYTHEGGNGYVCGATGLWEGDPPRCITPWQTSEWSNCSASCGLTGVQRRTVQCPSGRTCETVAPASQRDCRSTIGCTWAVHEWSSCSSSCGSGTKHRAVACSSGIDADCSGERPTTQQTCTDYAGCSWQLSAWGLCSSTCGTGTQSRTVFCPAEDAVHCGDSLPSTVQTCRNTSACLWQSSSWSECSTLCGDGTSSRQVWCPSGLDTDCPGGRPVETQDCRATSGCSWTVGTWSDCSNGCGPGTQSRSVGCPTGLAADCPGEAPISSRSCYSTAGCVWLTTAWGACTSNCGAGLRARVVLCLSGVDADCHNNQKPLLEEPCSSTSGCSWSAGDWSQCSTSCGQGLRSRSVLCASGVPSDCGTAAPVGTEECRNTTTCAWRVTTWSSCSNSCGSGQQVRNASCSSGEDSDCQGDRPLEAAACHQTNGCGWLLGPWSACNVSCGPGYQNRSAICESANASDCQGPGPGTLQHCHSTWGCDWITGNWGNCSSSCGSGSRRRPLACSSGDIADCHGSRPAESEPCYEADSCDWYLTDWGSCSAPDCGSGLRVRQVSCPSGVAADCGISPSTTEICRRTSGCMWLMSNWSDCSNGCGDGNSSRSVTCTGVSDEDCAEERPQAWRSCRSARNCAWQAGWWSVCNTTCGEGMQVRNVVCPSGQDLDCQSLRPAAEQRCHSTAACSWQASAWSDCSHSCGPGVRTRALVCGSGRDVDCAAAERPLDQQDCGLQRGNCDWDVGSWSSCSATLCGSTGTRHREVTCPSASGTVGCPAVRPLSSESCRALGACAWVVAGWSACQAECGMGTQVRTVLCPSVYDSDCAIEKPNTSRSCHSTAGCRWWLGSWSACSSTCGVGEQTRHVECEGTCEGTGPSRTQTCRETSTCQWAVSAWGLCDSTCGSGLQWRDVTCPTGIDADCPQERPAQSQRCQSSSSCAWRAAAWGACGPACGPGLQTREVVCDSGHDGDCQHLPKPSASQACNSTRSCTWRLTSWSACSEACGSGLRSRAVSCPAADEAHCTAQKPNDTQSCASSTGCLWNLSEWSACSATCGQGTQNRTTTCSQPGGCTQPGPTTWQYCHSSEGCQWSVEDWSACSNPCGSGLRSREVRCAGLVGSACQGSPPATTEDCFGTSGCEWRVGGWSTCGDACDPEVRELTCSGGSLVRCGGEAPATARPCSAEACSLPAAEDLQFHVRLEVSEMPSASQLEQLLKGTKAAVAEVLQVSPSLVSVSVVPDGRRRLSSSSSQLRIVVQVTSPPVGASRMIQIPEGKATFVKALRQELASRGLATASASVDTEVTAPPSNARDNGTEEMTVEDRDQQRVTMMILGVVAGLLLTALAALGTWLLWRGWRRRAREARKVSDDPGKDRSLTFIEVQAKGGLVDMDVGSLQAALATRKTPSMTEGLDTTTDTASNSIRAGTSNLRAAADVGTAGSAPRSGTTSSGATRVEAKLPPVDLPRYSAPGTLPPVSPSLARRLPPRDFPRPETPTRIPSAADPPHGRKSPPHSSGSPGRRSQQLAALASPSGRSQSGGLAGPAGQAMRP